MKSQQIKATLNRAIRRKHLRTKRIKSSEVFNTELKKVRKQVEYSLYKLDKLIENMDILEDNEKYRKEILNSLNKTRDKLIEVKHTLP